MAITIVLVTWNSAPYLRRCLDGILQQTYSDRELIVVDNASTDGSVDIVAPHATRVIRNETNRGFSAAVNQALAIASGEFLLVVNPDCYLEAEYAERLVEVFTPRHPERRARDLGGRGGRRDPLPVARCPGFLNRATGNGSRATGNGSRATPAAPPAQVPRYARDDSARIGSATGVLIRARGWDIEPTNAIDSAGMRMTRNGRHLDITTRPDSLVEVFGVSGAAAMYRVEFLRDVAIDGEALDEDFFAYREDADLAWRGQLRGWRAVCEPRAVGYHVRRVTPEARRKLPADVNLHSVKNRFLLRIKNEGAYLALRNAPFELARDLMVIAAALTIERSSLPAFAWLWRNRRRVLAKRRAIQSRRTVSDRDLAKWWFA